MCHQLQLQVRPLQWVRVQLRVRRHGVLSTGVQMLRRLQARSC